MSTPPAPPLTVVQPGEGRVGEVIPGFGVVFKLWSADTGGAVSIVEHPFEPGVLVPPHLHTREDEFSIVTEGEIGFRSGDREVVLGPGGYITKPRGELHSMWNAGDVPARMIEVISPGGFEHFFREMTELVAAGPPLFADVLELGAKYGLEFGEPEWLPDGHRPVRADPAAAPRLVGDEISPGPRPTSATSGTASSCPPSASCVATVALGSRWR